ncbi:cell envelope biogenesis protein TolA [Bradyrhizobium sp. HKCCYLS1011]|uniref:cell envelope biogenesis protein TolA n=1 Tax=Bradyrhizobium sp. HKCCYLS1011 TaxID=3420733 RepID=UPI003EBB7FCC
MPKKPASRPAGKPARKLKTFQTSLGFFDLAVAAPSMKAALEAWGASSNLFHQGAARETDDPGIVAATMAQPGIVLRRPVGSNEPFAEHAGLPTTLPGPEPGRPRKSHRASQRPSSRTTDEAADSKAALAFAWAQKQRDATRRKEEAALAKLRARREAAVAKAEAALDKARREHEARAGAIDAERAAIDERADAEAERWRREKERLEEALRKARA